MAAAPQARAKPVCERPRRRPGYPLHGAARGCRPAPEESLQCLRRESRVRSRNVLVAGVDLLPLGYDEPRGKVAIRQMLDKIAALPGVTAVSTVRRVPSGLGGSSSSSIRVEGYAPAKNEEMIARVHTIGPDYFRTMSTPLLSGREFTAADTDPAQPAVVINETLAKRYFGKSEPSAAVSPSTARTASWWA